MGINRHKVFVSYYHHDDQKYKESIIKWEYYNKDKGKYETIFDNYSVGNGDIDDEKLTDEQIRRIIKKEYINEASVLLLLCGKETKNRKHIDWEIQAAMHGDGEDKLGIVVINLPTINQGKIVADTSEKELISPNGQWITLTSRKEYEDNYPYMPSRIIDNFEKKIPIAVVDWERINENKTILIELIDNAFNRRENIKYDYSAPLRRKNS